MHIWNLYGTMFIHETLAREKTKRRIALAAKRIISIHECSFKNFANLNYLCSFPLYITKFMQNNFSKSIKFDFLMIVQKPTENHDWDKNTYMNIKILLQYQVIC